MVNYPKPSVEREPMWKNILKNDQFDIIQLASLAEKPEPFTPGVPRFWDDT
jgi:hypothetical protein